MILSRAIRESRMSGLRRWAAFYSVGGLGFIVQLASLYGLVQCLGLHYLAATIIAVEAAVLHNFVWHEHWTWADRRRHARGGLPGRLARFHLANGALSMAGNLVAMKILAGLCGMNCMFANGIAVAASSVLNFLAGDLFVFPRITGHYRAEGE